MRYYIKKKLVNIATWFIFNKNKRHEFREKYLNTNSKKTNEKFLNQINNDEHIIILDKDENSPLKILHYSTYKIKCGIASYLEDYISGLRANGYNYNAVVPVNYDYLSDCSLITAYLDKIVNYASDYDIVSIQHEYSFWNPGNKYNADLLLDFIGLDKKNINLTKITMSLILLDYFITKLFRLNKRVNIVWHTSFELSLKDCFSLNVDSYKNLPFFRYLDNPLLSVVVMNSKFIEELKLYKIPVNRVLCMQLPIPSVHIDIKKSFGFNDEDVILGSFGFINKMKGIEDALKALKYLPKNYKYIHLGGVHPADASGYVNTLKKYIDDNNLNERVVITGFLSDIELYNYIKIVDIGLYIGKMTTAYASGAINYFIVNSIPTLTSDISNFKEMESKFGCIKVIDNTDNSLNVAECILKLDNDESAKNFLRSNCKAFCEINTFKNFTKNNVEYIFDKKEILV